MCEILGFGASRYLHGLECHGLEKIVPILKGNVFLILARNEGKHALDLNINKLGEEQSWEMDLMRKQKWLESESEGSIQG